MARPNRSQESDKTWLLQLLADAQRQGWYGTMHLHFEGGQIVRARKEESLLPPSRGGDQSPSPELQELKR